MSTTMLRYSLWASFPFNMVGAGILAFPGSALGQFSGLPATVPAIYSATLALLVAWFGFAYAWLAMQREINRPLVTFSAIAKAGVFFCALALWFAGNASGRMLSVTCVDLAFAALWFSWLVTSPKES